MPNDKHINIIIPVQGSSCFYQYTLLQDFVKHLFHQLFLHVKLDKFLLSRCQLFFIFSTFYIGAQVCCALILFG